MMTAKQMTDMSMPTMPGMMNPMMMPMMGMGMNAMMSMTMPMSMADMRCEMMDMGMACTVTCPAGMDKAEFMRLCECMCRMMECRMPMMLCSPMMPGMSMPMRTGTMTDDGMRCRMTMPEGMGADTGAMMRDNMMAMMKSGMPMMMCCGTMPMMMMTMTA